MLFFKYFSSLKIENFENWNVSLRKFTLHIWKICRIEWSSNWMMIECALWPFSRSISRVCVKCSCVSLIICKNRQWNGWKSLKENKFCVKSTRCRWISHPLTYLMMMSTLDYIFFFLNNIFVKNTRKKLSNCDIKNVKISRFDTGMNKQKILHWILHSPNHKISLLLIKERAIFHFHHKKHHYWRTKEKFLNINEIFMGRNHWSKFSCFH